MSATASTGSDNSLPIGTRLSDFEITGVLGEGGFGIVYLAFDHALQRTVAIKEYMPGALAGRDPNHGVSMRAERHRATFNIGLKSFINEARFLAQFDHPALVKVFRFWEQNQTAYTAMQYYDGRTVKDIVAHNPELVTQAWCTKLAGQVLDALGMLGTMQLVHRDVSPDNIIVQPNGDAVLLDFGSARQILGDMTHGLTVILKPGYAPVEQYAGDAALAQGQYTDIYALSAVLYFAVTGAPPPTSIARMIKDPVVPLATRDLPGYTTAFLAAIDAGMAVLAENRPQTTDAMRALLGIAQAGAPRVKPAGSTERFATVAHAETPAPTVAEQDDADRTVIATPAQVTAARAAAAGLAATPAPAGGTSPAPTASSGPDGDQTQIARTSPGSSAAPAASTAAAASAATSASSISASSKKSAASTAPTSSTVSAASTAPASPNVSAASPAPTTPKSGTTRAIDPRVRKAGIVGGALAAAAIVMFVLFGRPADTVMVAPSQAPQAAQTPAGDAQVAGVPTAPAPAAASVAPSSSASIATSAAPAIITDDQPDAHPSVAVPPAAPVAEPIKPAEPVPETASYKLAIKPWGTIYVDGKERGVSPPLKRLVLPAGRHKIRIVNPGFPEYQTEVTLGANKSGVIERDFPAAQDH